MGRGNFITFEGGDGTGKSTQIARLETRLKDRGLLTVTTREPGGSPGAEQIRKLLLTGDLGRWDETSEALLFSAARRNHVETLIKPALKVGNWVLCDRFSDSTMAYQGIAGGMGRDLINTLNHQAIGDFEPDLTLVLDLPYEEGLKRSGARTAGDQDPEDRFERKGEEFHGKLRLAFLEIAALNPNRCQIIDATGSEQEVGARIWKCVEGKFFS
ncbi:MAG: dTMP kinase [Sphingomonadales bacterium]